MAAAFFLYAASGLVAPWWAVTLLMLVWVGLFALCCAWWRLHPGWLPWVPAAATVFWFAALVCGGVFLGWSP